MHATRCVMPATPSADASATRADPHALVLGILLHELEYHVRSNKARAAGQQDVAGGVDISAQCQIRQHPVDTAVGRHSVDDDEC